MPLPKPKKREKRDAFIQRCMGNPTMVKEFPKSAQRRAVCQSQWANKAAGAVAIRADASGIISANRHDPQALAKAHGDFQIASAPVEWIEAAAGDSEKLTKFRIRLYNGGPMRIGGYYLPIIVDIAGLTAQRQIAVLLNHDPDHIAGHAEPDMRARVVDLKNGVMSGDPDTVEKVRGMAVRKFPWRASLGASPHKMELIDEDETGKANGRTFKGPCIIMRSGELGEGSFVPVGADQTTSVSVAASGTVRGGEAMEFDKWLKAQDIDKDTADPKTISAMKKMWLAQGSPEGDPADPPADPAPADPPADPPTPAPAADPATPEATATLIEAGIAKGVEKATGIMAAEQIRLGAVQAVVDAFAGQLGATKAAQIKGEAMKDKWTPDHTELICMRAVRVEGSIGIVTGDAADRPGAPEVLEAALAMNAGVKADNIVPEGISKEAGERIVNAASERRMRSIGFRDIMAACVQAAGKHFPAGRITDQHIRLALDCDKQIRGAAGTTFSLSGILGNVQGKTLLQAFTAIDAVSTRVSKKASYNDFKTKTTYRLVGTGEIEEVPPSGKLKQVVGFAEDSYENKLKTRGCVIMIGRQQLINDDLGAFQQTGAVIGHKSAVAREKRFFTVLNGTGAGTSHFTAANGNYVAGAAYVVGLAGYDEAERTFNVMVHKKSGDHIGIVPEMVLVPAGAKRTGLNIFSTGEVIATSLGSTSARLVEPRGNTWRGQMPVESSPWMSNSGLTGNSATAWYMLGNPAQFGVIEIGYLNGVDSPTIQAVAPDADVLGVATQCFWDFEVALAEIYGGVKLAGA